jgi:predicted dehydrogenase
MPDIAVIGAGVWGKNLVRTFSQLGVLWGFADQSEPVRKNLGALYPNAQVCTSIDEVLASDEVRAVVIATPAPGHFENARKALLAGRHALVEKPLTLSVKDSLELVELAEKQNCILMVGHLLLYHPAVTRMKHYCQTGELGDLYYIYGQRVNLGQVRRDENAMWSLGPHDVSIVNYLFDDRPVRVAAIGSCHIQRDVQVEDVVFLNLQFADGRMANVHLSWLDPHKIRRMTLVGSKKMVVFDDILATEKLKLYDKGVSGYAGGKYDSYGDAITYHTGDILIPKIDMTEPLKLECLHFLDCIRKGERPLTDGVNGLEVVRVLEAAQQSLKSNGAPISL